MQSWQMYATPAVCLKRPQAALLLENPYTHRWYCSQFWLLKLFGQSLTFYVYLIEAPKPLIFREGIFYTLRPLNLLYSQNIA